jgi:hypothetical protein
MILFLISMSFPGRDGRSFLSILKEIVVGKLYWLCLTNDVDFGFERRLKFASLHKRG